MKMHDAANVAKLGEWDIVNTMGSFHFRLMGRLTKDNKLSVGLFCNKPIYLLDEYLFDGVEDDFIQGLRTILRDNKMEGISAVSLIHTDIIKDFFSNIISYFFSTALDNTAICMGVRNQPDTDCIEIEPGEEVMAFYDIMPKLNNATSSKKEEPQEELQEESQELAEAPQETPEDPIDESEVNSQEEDLNDPSEELSPEPEIEPEVIMKNEVVTPAIPDKFDNLNADIALLSRNIKKIVDLQRLGGYTINDKCVSDIQSHLTALKQVLAETLLQM